MPWDEICFRVDVSSKPRHQPSSLLHAFAGWCAIVSNKQKLKLTRKNDRCARADISLVPVVSVFLCNFLFLFGGTGGSVPVVVPLPFRHRLVPHLAVIAVLFFIPIPTSVVETRINMDSTADPAVPSAIAAAVTPIDAAKASPTTAVTATAVKVDGGPVKRKAPSDGKMLKAKKAAVAVKKKGPKPAVVSAVAVNAPTGTAAASTGSGGGNGDSTVGGASKPAKTQAIAKRFEMHLELLKVYKNANNGQDPPREYSVEHDGKSINLGKWCHNQRQKRNRKQLSAANISRLEELDFSWGGSPESTWKEYFSALKEYKQAHDGTEPPATCVVFSPSMFVCVLQFVSLCRC